MTVSRTPEPVAELVDRDGQLLARYDKIHLFDVDLPDGNTYRESATVNPGRELPPVVDVPGLCKVGLSICYDVRFPELYRHLVGAGADLLMIPAAFTAFTGKDHWQVLLQARAIENTAYVLAPAQTGVHYGRRHSHGHAMVIDPWGTVLADAGVLPGAAIAPVNTNHIRVMFGIRCRAFGTANPRCSERHGSGLVPTDGLALAAALQCTLFSPWRCLPEPPVPWPPGPSPRNGGAASCAPAAMLGLEAFFQDCQRWPRHPRLDRHSQVS